MAKRGSAGKVLEATISHEVAQQWLLPYYYHRLSPTQDAALEAHARTCVHCRAEGFGHLATERMQAMRQRSRLRQPLTRPLMISLSLLLGLLVVFAGLLIYVAGRDGSWRSAFGRSTSQTVQAAVATNTPVPPTATPAPAMLSASPPLGTSVSQTLAATADGSQLALAANMTGVALYKNGKLSGHLNGFEGFNAPGAMLWSPDGKYLAASGTLTLFVWNVTTGTTTGVRLKENAGTDLYIFDWAANKIVGSVKSSLFATSGFVQWGDKGSVVAAPAGSAAAGNIPENRSPIFALWSGQQGIRVFHDATGTVQIGISDADISAHAAFLRWSPDGRYLLWGYPRVAISSTLVGAAGSPPSNAVGAPNPAVAMLVTRLGTVTDPTATITLWPAPDGLRLAYMESTGGTAKPASFAIIDNQTTAVLLTLPNVTITGRPTLGALTWETTAPVKIALAVNDKPASEYTAG